MGEIKIYGKLKAQTEDGIVVDASGIGLDSNHRFATDLEKQKLADLENYDDTAIRGLITTETSRATSQEEKALYHLGASDSKTSETSTTVTFTRKTGYVKMTDLSWNIVNIGSTGQYGFQAVVPADMVYSADINNSGPFKCSKYEVINYGMVAWSWNKIGVYDNHFYVRDQSAGGTSSDISLSTFLKNIAGEIIEYEQRGDGYSETLIKDRPLNTLDLQGSQWLRKEWRKTQNLIDVTKSSYSGGFIYDGVLNVPTGTYCIVIYAVGSATCDVTINGTSQGYFSNNTAKTFNYTAGATFKIYVNGSVTNLKVMLNEGNYPYPYHEYCGPIVHNQELMTNNFFSIKGLYVRKYYNSASIETEISANAYGGGRTILVMFSCNTSSGNNTNSEIGYIRCGYDGGNVSYYRISANGSDSSYYLADVLQVGVANGHISFTRLKNVQYWLTLLTMY